MQAFEIIRILEKLYPKDLAYDYDNVGLLIGSSNTKVTNILIALDLNKEVLKEAMSNKVDMIVTHHPFIFKPISNIITDSYKGNIISKLIKNDIVLYAAHTNFDLSFNGMNDALCKKLGLNNIEVLDFIDDTNGIGRIGDIDPISMKEFICHTKKSLNLEHVSLIGKEDKIISTVAISGGSGSSHIGIAKRKGADVYLTGDITFHVAQDALVLGINVLDIGHCAEDNFKSYLKDILINEGVSSNVLLSKINTNIMKIY